LVTGTLIGALVRRRPIAGPALVATAIAVFAWRQPEAVPEALVERPLPGAVFVAVMVWTVLAVRILRWGDPPPATALVAAIAACVGVWATAPDTEAALITGAVLLAAAPWVRSASIASLAAVTMLAPLAAVAGTVGRPERLPLVLAIALSAFGLARLAAAVLVWTTNRGQRAGMPTTVAPGATFVRLQE
jgi:hypothetical protein